MKSGTLQASPGRLTFEDHSNRALTQLGGALLGMFRFSFSWIGTKPRTLHSYPLPNRVLGESVDKEPE